MLTNTPVLTVAIALCLGAFAPSPVETPVLDGHGPPSLSESDFSFTCPGIRATVRYRQERFDPDTVGLENSLRVTLLELTASGVNLSAEHVAAAREVFRSFASVRDVSASCHGEGVATFSVTGMPHGPFMEALRDDEDGLPELVTRSLRLDASGLLRAD